MSKPVHLPQMSKRSWNNIAITYIVLFFASNIFFGPGIDKISITPWQAVFFAPLLWGFSLFCIQFESVHTRFSHVERKENPIAFWINIIILIIIGLGFFFWGLSHIIFKY